MTFCLLWSIWCGQSQILRIIWHSKCERWLPPFNGSIVSSELNTWLTKPIPLWQWKLACFFLFDWFEWIWTSWEVTPEESLVCTSKWNHTLQRWVFTRSFESWRKYWVTCCRGWNWCLFDPVNQHSNTVYWCEHTFHMSRCHMILDLCAAEQWALGTAFAQPATLWQHKLQHVTVDQTWSVNANYATGFTWTVIKAVV